MAPRTHVYRATTVWSGNRGSGTSGYWAYGREHEICAPDKATVIAGSATPLYRGDKTRYNPEELLVASLSACHMLWFLHLCAESGRAVQSYRDEASGTMQLNADGSGQFSQVVLHPLVTFTEQPSAEEAAQLHKRAHALCFIARSGNFPVLCEPAS
ncbi:MAG: OsmC family protein [Candidatus Baltobacteraceae bacterium]